ncbi:MAG: carbohydrate ABC transporter permease, partial [Protaetiibacter sp.]
TDGVPAVRAHVPAGTRRIRARGRRPVRTTLIAVGVLVWLGATLGPYLVMLLTSLTPNAQLIAPGTQLIPENPTLQAYEDLFTLTPFLGYLRNSVLTAVGTVVLTLIVSVCAAISLSRFEFRARKTVLTGLLVAQLFPAVLLVIALQTELRTMGLLDSQAGLILVYTTFASPFATFLLKGFLDNLPKELDEAAAIDGAGPLKMVLYILLPLMRPGLSAAGTYVFIFSWNEFLYALTFTSTKAQTIPVGLHTFIGDYQIRWDLLTAGGVVAALPVLIGFMIVQRQLIDGLTAGAVKG